MEYLQLPLPQASTCLSKTSVNYSIHFDFAEASKYTCLHKVTICWQIVTAQIVTVQIVTALHGTAKAKNVQSNRKHTQNPPKLDRKVNLHWSVIYDIANISDCSSNIFWIKQMVMRNNSGTIRGNACMSTHIHTRRNASSAYGIINPSRFPKSRGHLVMFKRATL